MKKNYHQYTYSLGSNVIQKNLNDESWLHNKKEIQSMFAVGVVNKIYIFSFSSLFLKGYNHI